MGRAKNLSHNKLVVKRHQATHVQPQPKLSTNQRGWAKISDLKCQTVSPCEQLEPKMAEKS